MAKRFTALFFLAAIIGFMCWSVVSYGAKKAGDFFEEEKAQREEAINWAALYPFSDSEEDRKNAEAASRMKSIYELVKKACEGYTSDHLLGYYNVVEAARTYEELIGWNLARIVDDNGVVKLRDGYFTTFTNRQDVTSSAEAVTEFARYCQEREIEFFYGNLPHKVCKYEDSDVSGKLDFANQNADEFLAQLAENGVRYIDFRKLLHEEGMNHHGAFFRTDHHWKPETGLWAARHILEYLKENCGWDVEPEVLDPERFSYVNYPEWFLGSQGKKVTLSRAKPDDITLIYPKDKTLLNFKVTTKSLDLTGDFSVIYNMKQVTSKDYYVLSPYHAYVYGDQALIRINNALVKNGRRVLLIHDSFSDVVIPFLGLGTQYADAIDLRHFTGSLKRFMAETKPDAVAVMYHSGYAGSATVTPSHTSVYDFR